MSDSHHEPPFSSIASERQHRAWWVVILAGEARPAAGSFLPPWFWRPRPAQFRTLLGWRSVLRHTADRALHLVRHDRVVTIIDREHIALFEDAAGEHYPGLVMTQPSRHGTAAEVLLGLSAVLRRDPSATVLLLPASQFAVPEDRFLCAALRAMTLAEQDPTHAIVLGAAADGAEGCQVWIEPDRARDPLLVTWGVPNAEVEEAVAIRRFLEQPEAEAAEELRRQGGLHCTMVVAGSAATLWGLGRRHLPATLERFERFRSDAHDPDPAASGVGGTLQMLYEGLSREDFSRDILQRSADAVMALPVEDVQFGDLGKPRRLRPAVKRLLRRAQAAHAME